MNRYLVVGAMGLGLLAFSTWALAGSKKAADATPSMTKWEYHCVLPPMAVPVEGEGEHASHGHPSVAVLNHLGSLGWELVAIDGQNGHYCFKRPLP